MQKRAVFVCSILFLVLLTNFVSASWFSDILNKITGHAVDDSNCKEFMPLDTNDFTAARYQKSITLPDGCLNGNTCTLKWYVYTGSASKYSIYSGKESVIQFNQSSSGAWTATGDARGVLNPHGTNGDIKSSKIFWAWNSELYDDYSSAETSKNSITYEHYARGYAASLTVCSSNQQASNPPVEENPAPAPTPAPTPTPTPNPTPTPSTSNCTDSDGGLDYYVKGKLTRNGELYKDSVDYCIDEKKLFEYDCGYDNGVSGSAHKAEGGSSYPCPNGCSNGTCLQSSAAPNEDCRLIATTMENGKKFTDKIAKRDYLGKYYLNFKQPVYKSYYEPTIIDVPSECKSPNICQIKLKNFWTVNSQSGESVQSRYYSQDDSGKWISYYYDSAGKLKYGTDSYYSSYPMLVLAHTNGDSVSSQVNAVLLDDYFISSESKHLKHNEVSKDKLALIDESKEAGFEVYVCNNASETRKTCTDADAGSDSFFTSSYITFNNQRINDTCKDSDILQEKGCISNIGFIEEYQCPIEKGCINGKCIKPVCSETPIIDTVIERGVKLNMGKVKGASVIKNKVNLIDLPESCKSAGCIFKTEFYNKNGVINISELYYKQNPATSFASPDYPLADATSQCSDFKRTPKLANPKLVTQSRYLVSKWDNEYSTSQNGVGMLEDFFEGKWSYKNAGNSDCNRDNLNINFISSELSPDKISYFDSSTQLGMKVYVCSMA